MVHIAKYPFINYLDFTLRINNNKQINLTIISILFCGYLATTKKR